MLISALIALPSLNPIAFNLDGMVEAQARIQRERITATADTYSQAGHIVTTQILDIDRGREARIQFQPDTLKPYVEVFYYKIDKSGSIANAYRPESGQYTQTKSQEQNLAVFVKAATPTVDDFLVSLLIKDGLDAFVDRLNPNMPGWQIIAKNDTVILILKKNGTNSKVVLNQSNLRPIRMDFSNPGNALSWKFSYAPLKSIAPPSSVSGAFLVSQFDAMLGKATTASQSAKSGLDKLFSRYDSPKSLGYTVTTDGESTDIFYCHEYAYQSDALVEWKYDGSLLTLYNKSTKRLHQGPATREQLIAAVAATGSRIETGLRNLIVGRNPYRLIMNNFTSVASKGQTTQGEPAEILFADSPFADMKFTVAKKDGFVLKVESTPKTNSGEKLPTSVSTYKRSTGAKASVFAPASATKGTISELSP